MPEGGIPVETSMKGAKMARGVHTAGEKIQQFGDNLGLPGSGLISGFGEKTKGFGRFWVNRYKGRKAQELAARGNQPQREVLGQEPLKVPFGPHKQERLQKRHEKRHEQDLHLKNEIGVRTLHYGAGGIKEDGYANPDTNPRPNESEEQRLVRIQTRRVVEDVEVALTRKVAAEADRLYPNDKRRQGEYFTRIRPTVITREVNGGNEIYAVTFNGTEQQVRIDPKTGEVVFFEEPTQASENGETEVASANVAAFFYKPGTVERSPFGNESHVHGDQLFYADANRKDINNDLVHQAGSYMGTNVHITPQLQHAAITRYVQHDLQVTREVTAVRIGWQNVGQNDEANGLRTSEGFVAVSIDDRRDRIVNGNNTSTNPDTPQARAARAVNRVISLYHDKRNEILAIADRIRQTNPDAQVIFGLGENTAAALVSDEWLRLKGLNAKNIVSERRRTPDGREITQINREFVSAEDYKAWQGLTTAQQEERRRALGEDLDNGIAVEIQQNESRAAAKPIPEGERQKMNHQAEDIRHLERRINDGQKLSEDQLEDAAVFAYQAVRSAEKASGATPYPGGIITLDRRIAELRDQVYRAPRQQGDRTYRDVAETVFGNAPEFRALKESNPKEFGELLDRVYAESRPLRKAANETNPEEMKRLYLKAGATEEMADRLVRATREGQTLTDSDRALSQMAAIKEFKAAGSRETAERLAEQKVDSDPRLKDAMAEALEIAYPKPPKEKSMIDQVKDRTAPIGVIMDLAQAVSAFDVFGTLRGGQTPQVAQAPAQVAQTPLPEQTAPASLRSDGTVDAILNREDRGDLTPTDVRSDASLSTNPGDENLTAQDLAAQVAQAPTSAGATQASSQVGDTTVQGTTPTSDKTAQQPAGE